VLRADDDELLLRRDQDLTPPSKVRESQDRFLIAVGISQCAVDSVSRYFRKPEYWSFVAGLMWIWKKLQPPILGGKNAPSQTQNNRAADVSNGHGMTGAIRPAVPTKGRVAAQELPCPSP
jgi:hypothetical protein